MLRCALQLLSAATAAAEWVSAPGGRLLPAECVHKVESGTVIREADDGVLTVTEPGKAPRALPHCAKVSAPRHCADFKTWAQYKPASATHVSFMSNQWKVPTNPPAGDKGQVLFYWNGLEDGGDSGGSGVLQPVLQFGQDTPNGWGIKSWYAGSGGTVMAKVVKVKPGDLVTGNMTQLADGTWTCTAVGSGAPSTLHYDGANSKKFTYAYEVLEAAGVTKDASLYPSTGAIAFTDTQLAFDGTAVQPPFKWETYSCPGGPGCGNSSCAQLGEKTTTSDDGTTVTIHWQTK